MIDTWVEAKLTGYTAFDGISAGLTGRIYNAYAPPDALYPFIIFQVQSPADIVRGVGTAEVLADTLYVVKAIAQGTDFSALAPVAEGIRSALVESNGVAVTGGHIYVCRYERQFSMTEAENTKQYRHLGGEYRIQARAS